MSDEWLNPQQAAECLNCPSETVRAMLRGGLLAGEKLNGRWRVKAAKVEALRVVMTSAPPPSTPVPRDKVDPGIVEVTMALAGIAAAIAAFLPKAAILPESLVSLGTIMVGTVAVLAGIVAAFSAYSALWFLAWYRVEGESAAGLSEIKKLLFSPVDFGPYWLVAWGLLVWLVLSVLVGAMAVMR